MSHLAHYPLQMYCRQLSGMFQQAVSRRDPAWWLYKNEARSLLFMAESLARIIAAAMHSKKAEKACALFKKLEDLLGEIDDFDHLAGEYAKHATVKKEEVAYFTGKRDKALDKLNKLLYKHEFYQDAFYKVQKKLDVNFNDAATVSKLREALKLEIEKGVRFYNLFRSGFSDMESQVHEIRRKLRWISIYGESFNGLIALDKTKSRYKWEKNYILRKAKDDPYNILLENHKFSHHILFDQKAFYAVNRVVEELGKIKNEGLETEFLAKAIRKLFDTTREDAEQAAYAQLKPKHTNKELLQQAHVLLKDFFETQAIHRLLIKA